MTNVQEVERSPYAVIYRNEYSGDSFTLRLCATSEDAFDYADYLVRDGRYEEDELDVIER